MGLEAAKEHAFVCCPFDLLVEQHLPRLAAKRINPEVGLNGGVLDRFRMPSFRRVARALRESGLRCTVHAPFADLSLGAIDPRIRRVTVERLRRTLEVSAVLEACSMVCHTGFDDRHYYGVEDRWLGYALESLCQLVEEATSLGIQLMLENVFELRPAIHKRLFVALASPSLSFCLDLGHQQVFSTTSLSAWLAALGYRLGQVHLHDNNGCLDDHLPIGQGCVDFDSLFLWLKASGRRPILTLEPHAEEAVVPTLIGLADLLDRYGIWEG